MRLWGDGFDHYGSDEGNMTDGQAYASADGALDTAQFATGTHSFRFNSDDDLSNLTGLRRVLTVAKDKMGAMARFYLPSFSSSVQAIHFDFLTSNPNTSHIACMIDGNGGIRFYRGSTYGFGMSLGTLVAQTDPALLTTAAWNHLEIQIYIHDTLGWIRVAVNGVHRYQATNLDTKQGSDANIYSVCNHREHGADSDSIFQIDDYALYDFTGDSAVDTDWCPTVDGSGIGTSYIGELDAVLSIADGDTAEADWLKSTGTDGYPLLGKATPNDSTYIYSTTATDLSEFTLSDLPEEITYIRGVDIHSRVSKSDSGVAMYQVGMKSVADVTDVTETPVTTVPAYYYSQVDVDPDSGARWTRESFNAAWLRQIRSA